MNKILVTIMQEDSIKSSKLSVIIRNKNESDHIGFSIQSCIDIFDKPEIIIVDNNSNDDSLEIANLFNDRTTIKYTTISDYSPGKSINKGVELATHDTILVLSAHSQIIECDLSIIFKYLKKYKAVFGNQIPVYKGKKISKRYIWSHFGSLKEVNMFSNIENRYFLHNAFCFYNKQFLQKHPMPESYPGKEDRFWAIDMVEKGYKYLYTPEISVFHHYTKRGATWKGIG